jgi:hypothetical protein
MRYNYDADGFIIVPDVVPDLANSVVAALPPNEKAAREYDWDGKPFLSEANPPQVLYDGPHPIPALNQLCLDHRILDIAETLLGETPVLSQWQLWVRYPGSGYTDQKLHVDYMNHTLLVPDQREGFRYAELIVYLTDIGPEDAPTYVVRNAFTESLPFVPYRILPEDHPEIYAAEEPVLASTGSVLGFGPGTWHRGSAFAAADRPRVAVHLAFRTAGTPWNGYTITHSRAYSPHFTDLVGMLDARQCVALGFPPPGHPYWTNATLKAIAMRYPTMDLSSFAKTAGADEPWTEART